MHVAGAQRSETTSHEASAASVSPAPSSRTARALGRARAGLWRLVTGSARLSRRDVALSVAAGLAIAFVPIYGVHSFLVLGVCSLLRLDAPLVFASTLLSNPFTWPLLLALEFEVGRALLGGAPLERELLSNGEGWSQAGLRVMLGAGVLALLTASVGAALTWWALRYWRGRRPSLDTC